MSDNLDFLNSFIHSSKLHIMAFADKTCRWATHFDPTLEAQPDKAAKN